MFTSAGLVYYAGLFQAVMVALGAYLGQPGVPTGIPHANAAVAVLLSAVGTYIAGHQVKGAVARETGGKLK